MKRILAILLAAVMVFSFAACGETKAEEKKEEQTATVKDTLVIGCEQEPYSLSPLESSGAPSARIRRLICQGLFDVNDAGEYIPLLATSWKWVDDVTLEFQLREGVTYSDGTPFTAADCKFTMENQIGKGGFFDQYFESATVVNDHCIQFKFNSPSALIFDHFNSKNFPVYNEALFKADGNEFAYNLIGTGPYKLVKWNTGESLTMTVNENYWGETPAIKTVTFKFITEDSQRTMEMETGGIDIDVKVNAADLTYFSDTTKYQSMSKADVFLNELYFNMSDIRKSPVQDVRVRQAIAYAFDTEAIQKTLKNGAGSVPTTNINPIYASIYEPGDETLYAYNLDKAKELMKEAGYEDGFELVVLDDGTQDYRDFSEMLIGALEPLNIKVTMLTRDYTTWYDTVLKKAEWDVCWFSLGDESPVYAFMHFLGDGTRIATVDYTTYRNDTFLDCLVEATTCTDNARLKELFRTMNQCMIDDLPMYTIYVPETISVYTADLQNYEYRNGMLNIEEMSFK